MSLPPNPLYANEVRTFQTRLLASYRQAVAAVDLDGRIVFWNLHAEKLFGWKASEALGAAATDLFATPSLMDTIQSNLTLFGNGETWLGDLPLRQRGGMVAGIRLSLSMVETGQRTIIGITCVSSRFGEHNQLVEANRLLAEASALLAEAVDIETPLTTLAQLAIPQLADWCAVHLLQPDGSVLQVALAPADIAREKPAGEWLLHQLPLDDVDGLPAVLRTGAPKLVNHIDQHSRAAAGEIRSYMIVPLITPPKTLGAITFIAVESDRQFDENALALAENLVSHISIYLEKANLYRESQRLNAVLEQRVDERTAELLSTVERLQESEAMIKTQFRIGSQLNSTLDLKAILDMLALEAIALVNGESGFAGLRTEAGMTVEKYFTAGKAIPFRHVWPAGQGVPGWVLEHRIPYGTADAGSDPRIDHSLRINAGIRTDICTPIIDSAGEVLGFFDIRNKQGAEGFSIRDQEMLLALAPAASIAIQNALSYRKRQETVARLEESERRLQALAANLELAREEERTQIARELHDQLGQALTAMKFDLAWLSDRLGKKNKVLAGKTISLTERMDAMIKAIRRIATELRPGMLDDLGLGASIEWQAKDFEKRTGIHVGCKVSGDPLALPRTQSLAMFRILQESLTNVARHANARRVKVSLTVTADEATLRIHDDGRGIQANETAGLHSLGLLGMRERATRLGGSFDIRGMPGDGTTVTVSIPVSQPDEDSGQEELHAENSAGR